MSISIALLSDTHGHIDDRIRFHCQDVDEIWHAGDIGGLSCADEYAKLKPFRAIYGNIDDHVLRKVYPEFLVFSVEGVKVCMLHIAVNGNTLNQQARDLIAKHTPSIFIYGHSHVPKVWKHHAFAEVLLINPGAVGKHGFHKVRTLMKLELNLGKVTEMNLIELEQR